MNSLTRQAIVVLVLVPLAVCVVGLRFACDSTDLRRIMREVRLNEKLQQSREATFRRIQAREEVVRGLIAQKCNLEEALARFQELDHGWPDYVTKLSKVDECNRSDEEQRYHYILAIAKGLLEKRPKETTAVLQRLEKDYQQLRAGRPMPSAMSRKRTEPSR